MRATGRRGAAFTAGLAALALGLLATPASAERAPTPEELTELAGATGPPSEPACVRGRISTVDERWAALFATSDGGCPRIERIWVLRRDAPGTPGNRWRELRQGIRFGVCARDLPGIPDAVGRDLGVCDAPSRRVFVPAGERFAFKPRTLPYGRSGSVGGLRWTSWGGRTATGRGTFAYRDGQGGGYRVRAVVTLSGIDLCGSRRTYLVKRLAAARPQDRAAVQAYGGVWPVQCPGVTSSRLTASSAPSAGSASSSATTMPTPAG